MMYETIRLQAEKRLSEELRSLFQMEVLEPILEASAVEDRSNPYLSYLRGQSFKVTPALTSKLFSLCEDVQKRLRMEEPVEYFIQSSQDLNAGASPRVKEVDPHIVVLNSAMLEKFSDEEMRFIVGHELGHLISKNAELTRIMRFVFPEADSIPTFFKDKMDTWTKLSELSADRFGFIAMPDMEVCQAVFFKLSSGLDTDRIEFDGAAYTDSLDDMLEAFESSGDTSASSHPINPIRMKALECFSSSALYKSQIESSGVSVEDDALESAIEPLVNILITKGTSALTAHRKIFLATSGLLMANADKEVSIEEVEQIVGVLANTIHFPRPFLEQIMQTDKAPELFLKSVTAILEVNPGERWPMLNYMISVATADRRLRSEELDLLYDLGEKVFEIPRKEVAQAIAQAIQADFIPRMLS